MKVGLSACSNGKSSQWAGQVDELIDVFAGMRVEAVPAEHVMAKIDEFSGTDEERAADLMKFYRDDSIEEIYDISGGDLANGVLKYLDWDVIAKSDKTFWGYSDLSTIVNAIYTMTGKESVLYQVENMVWQEGLLQQRRFAEYVKGNKEPLFNVKYEMLQGEHMRGTLVGGNIRCLLKLAGTKYWPDMKDKVLFLESYGGASGQIATLMAQLDIMGVFEQVAGVILGTYTVYEKADLEYSVYDLLKMHISPDLPVARTTEVGHGYDSKAIIIGREICI